MARFIERGIAQAEREGAQCVIIELDTPGGLDSSMRVIVQQIMGSRVPVIPKTMETKVVNDAAAKDYLAA